METDPVTIVLRDENGDEWRVTDSSPADSGPFVLRIDGPEGDSLQVDAQTRDEFRARLRRMLNDRPDVLALVPWLLKH